MVAAELVVIITITGIGRLVEVAVEVQTVTVEAEIDLDRVVHRQVEEIRVDPGVKEVVEETGAAISLDQHLVKAVEAVATTVVAVASGVAASTVVAEDLVI